jgi:hypothetical protein
MGSELSLTVFLPNQKGIAKMNWDTFIDPKNEFSGVPELVVMDAGAMSAQGLKDDMQYCMDWVADKMKCHGADMSGLVRRAKQFLMIVDPEWAKGAYGSEWDELADANYRLGLERYTAAVEKTPQQIALDEAYAALEKAREEENDAKQMRDYLAARNADTGNSRLVAQAAQADEDWNKAVKAVEAARVAVDAARANIEWD